MTEPSTVRIGTLDVSNAAPLTLIGGPCQLEGLDHALAIAEPLARSLRRGRRRLHLQGVLRQGEPHLADRAPRASAATRASRFSPRCATGSAARC